MIQKGINNLDLKIQNRKQILMTLKDYGPLPRKDISNLVNLTPAAVTIITNEMLDEGILSELGQQIESNKRAGRRKVLIDINYDLKYIVGISIESEDISIGICNLKGDILKSKSLDISLLKEHSELHILSLIASNCINLLWENNIKKEDVLGVGVGIIGPVDTINGISKNAYGIFSKNFPLTTHLEKLLHIPVCIDNNVRTLAMAELNSKDSNASDGSIIFIKYGPGIGATILINNEIYDGSNNSASELGHTIVKPYGDRCKCGRKGCLETVSSPKTIINKVQEIFSPDSTPILYKITNGDINNLSILNIIESAEAGEKNLISILKDASFYLSLALSNIITLYDPKEVILYGEFFNYEFFIDIVKSYLIDFTNSDAISKIINISKIEPECKFSGGVALALKKFFYSQGGKLELSH